MFANLSGFLTSMLFGFTGVQLGSGEPGTWAEHPVRLPAGWRAIRVERVWACGLPHLLEARAAATRATLVPARRIDV
jgi:protein-glucosylgalactosylhydroxylysine glucosidase